MVKTIHFMGILANVDSSILRMKFDRGFSAEEMSDNEGSELVSRLEEIPLQEAYKKLFMSYRCLNVSEQTVYALHNMFEAEIDESKHIMESAFSPIANFENEKVRGYLLDALRLMRLYKQGNICIPLWYYFLREDSTPQHIMTNWSWFLVVEELFSLGEDEIAALWQQD